MITAAFLGITGVFIGKNMFREGLYKAFSRNVGKISNQFQNYYKTEIDNIYKNATNVTNIFKYKFTPKPMNSKFTWSNFVKKFNENEKYVQKHLDNLKENPTLYAKVLENMNTNKPLDFETKEIINKISAKDRKKIHGRVQKLKNSKQYNYISRNKDEISVNKNISDMLSTSRIATIGFDGTAIGLTGVMGWNMKKEGRNV